MAFINYFTKNKNGQLEKAFALQPMIQDNPRMGKAANPDTKHFLSNDIYTHIAYADLTDPASGASATNKNAYKEPTNFIGHMGDTIFADNAIILIENITTNVNEQEYSKSDSLLEVTAILKVTDINGKVYYAKPKYIIKGNIIVPSNTELNELGLKFIFWKINPNEGSLEIQMSEKVSNAKDFIVLEAYMFPYINVLWIGCLMMVFGTTIAILERRRVNKIIAH